MRRGGRVVEGTRLLTPPTPGMTRRRREKLLVIQGFSRSPLSCSTSGYYSRQKCQNLARNHPQEYPRNFHNPIHRTDHGQPPPDFARKAQFTASRVTLDGNIATMWAGSSG